MKTTTYSNVRKNLKSYLDEVCLNHVPLHIERREGDDVVIISEDDYNSLEESAYLLKSPKNAMRLFEALNSDKTKKFNNINQLKDELWI